ncbi:phospholipase A2 inhibitor and Ly6/PLAUR domain-containing protein-like [Lithobates pipiens]
MTTYLLIAGILATLPATGYSLTCIECSVAADIICNGSSEVCSSGNTVCLLTRAVNKIGDMVTMNLYIRQCGPKELCSKTGSISLPNGRYFTSVTCCDTDNCTPPEPILPEVSKEKNGIKCPSCYVPNAKSCVKVTDTDCIGNETICITQITNVKGPVPFSTIARGCATKQLCDPVHQVWHMNKSIVDLQNVCENGGNHLHENILALIFSVYVLLKLMC